MKEIKVPLYKQYQQLVLEKDLGDNQMHRDLGVYRQLIVELVTEIETADNWIKSGGPDFIAMQSLMKKVAEVKEKLPGIYQ